MTASNDDLLRTMTYKKAEKLYFRLVSMGYSSTRALLVIKVTFLIDLKVKSNPQV